MNYPQRVRELTGQFCIKMGRSKDQPKLDPDELLDELDIALIDLITEAQIEELERLSKSGHAHFTAPIYIENRIATLKPKTGDQ